MFVGSPVKTDKTSLERMGRRLKKNNVAVDIVNFGEEAENSQKLEAFVNAVNSTDNNRFANPDFLVLNKQNSYSSIVTW